MRYVQIGFTRKTHGIQGELKIAIEPPFEDLFFEVERVFLEIKGIKQPFFIKSIRGGNALIVAFDDVNSREQAALLQSRPVFLPEAEIPDTLLSLLEERSPYEEWVGYWLIDQQIGSVGPIQAVIEMPQQWMAVVAYQGREVLVPLVPAFITAVDSAERRLMMDLPEGLLTLR